MAERSARSSSRRFRGYLAILAFTGAGLGVGGLIGASSKQAGDGGWFDTLTLSQLAWLPLWIFMVLLVHELGHVLGGRRAGMRFLLLMVGPLKVWRDADRLRFGWNGALGTWGGLAACLPTDLVDLSPRMKRLVAGGPLASLALAAAAGLGAAAVPAPVGTHLAFVALFSAAIFVATAIPARAGGFRSDGAQWLELHRGSPEVEQRHLVIALFGASLAGVRPRDYDRDLLRLALALPAEETSSVAAHALGLAAALDAGDPVAVQRHAQELERRIDAYPRPFQAGIAMELAYVAAREGRLDAARAWLQQGRSGVTEKAQRLRAEAAVALAEDDPERTEALAAKARAALGSWVDRGSACALEESLQLLEQEARARRDVPAG